MDDRVAEIREALNSPWWRTHKTGDSLDPTRSPTNKKAQIIDAAARAYADLLESDALIIRRDEGWAIAIISNVSQGDWSKQTVEWQQAARAWLDSASSQGVEP